jgi:CRP/FNR family transcriptional regulator, cyclic AMP receptor protein
MMSAHEVVLQQGWLSQTPPAFRRAVLEKSVLQTFDAGTPIYETGDTSGSMYGLVSGGVQVSLATGEQGPYFAHFFAPGEWFGEGPIISGRPRMAGMTASRRTEALCLSMTSMEEILAEQPMAWRLFALLALLKLETAIAAVDDLMIRDSFKRFVAVLLRLGNRRRAIPAYAPPINVDVSQTDLAHMANVTRSTANLFLRRLEGQGYLQQGYRRIVIVSADTLRAMLLE